MTKVEKERLIDRQRRWVINYLLANIEASVLSQDFHEQFLNEFGGPRRETCWGSQPVKAAMDRLKELGKDGTADVRRVSLGGARQPGLPNWVYSYSISDFGRSTYGK